VDSPALNFFLIGRGRSSIILPGDVQNDIRGCIGIGAHTIGGIVGFQWQAKRGLEDRGRKPLRCAFPPSRLRQVLSGQNDVRLKLALCQHDKLST